MISFIVRILSSVRMAVRILNRENTLPIQPVKETISHAKRFQNGAIQPCKGTKRIKIDNPAKHEAPTC